MGNEVVEREGKIVEVKKGTRSAPDRVLGWLGGAMVLVAVYLLIASAVREEGAATGEVADEVPPLELVYPADGEEVDPPLKVGFRSGAPISVQPGGWGAGGYHLHAELSGREAMPGAEDIRRLPDGSYEWTVRGAPAGAGTLRLMWSDEAHRPVEARATAPIEVILR